MIAEFISAWNSPEYFAECWLALVCFGCLAALVIGIWVTEWRERK